MNVLASTRTHLHPERRNCRRNPLTPVNGREIEDVTNHRHAGITTAHAIEKWRRLTTTKDMGKVITVHDGAADLWTREKAPENALI